MANLIPLFSVTPSYHASSWTAYSISRADLPLLYLELHRPNPEFLNGYFSVVWSSPLSNRQGIVALSDFYERLKKYYKEPNGAKKFHENSVQVLGEDCEFHLTFAPQDKKSRLENKIQFFTGSLKLEPGFEEPLYFFLLQDVNIPLDFSFMRLDSPYCGLYFGGNNYRTIGVDSEYLFPFELARLFEATGIYPLRTGESRLLISKLEELLGHMPRLEAKQ